MDEDHAGGGFCEPPQEEAAADEEQQPVGPSLDEEDCDYDAAAGQLTITPETEEYFKQLESHVPLPTERSSEAFEQPGDDIWAHLAEASDDEQDEDAPVSLEDKRCCRFCSRRDQLDKLLSSVQHFVCRACRAQKKISHGYKFASQTTACKTFRLTAKDFQKFTESTGVRLAIKEVPNPLGYSKIMKLLYIFQLYQICAWKYGSVERCFNLLRNKAALPPLPPTAAVAGCRSLGVETSTGVEVLTDFDLAPAEARDKRAASGVQRSSKKSRAEEPRQTTATVACRHEEGEIVRTAGENDGLIQCVLHCRNCQAVMSSWEEI